MGQSKAKGHRAVSSFPEIYMAMLMKAVKDGQAGPVHLPHGKAVHLRHELYMLRKSMRQEGHPLSELAQSVTIRLDPDTTSPVYKQDKNGKDVYEMAYVTATTGGEDVVEDAMRDAGITLDSINEMLEEAPVAPAPAALPVRMRLVDELEERPIPQVDYASLLPKEEED